MSLFVCVCVFIYVCLNVCECMCVCVCIFQKILCLFKWLGWIDFFSTTHTNKQTKTKLFGQRYTQTHMHIHMNSVNTHTQTHIEVNNLCVCVCISGSAWISLFYSFKICRMCSELAPCHMLSFEEVALLSTSGHAFYHFKNKCIALFQLLSASFLRKKYVGIIGKINFSQTYFGVIAPPKYPV